MMGGDKFVGFKEKTYIKISKILTENIKYYHLELVNDTVPTIGE